MKKLTLETLRSINKNYDYNYNNITLQDIYNELTITDTVSFDDIIEQFENI